MDRMSSGTSRCPFVPGQKYFLVPLSLCPGTRAGAKLPGQTHCWYIEPRNREKRLKKNTIFEKKKKIIVLTFLTFFCPRTEEFAPGFFLLLLSRDKGTAGQGNFFVPGQRDNGTSRPLETLVPMNP